MTIVKHVLDKKGHDVQLIHPDASVFDALKVMAENKEVVPVPETGG